MEVSMVFVLGVLVIRIGMLVAGILFCWFGYRLFGQTNSHGSANISVSDNLKLNIQHIGPGVFFSLFGAAILVYNIYKAPTLDIIKDIHTDNRTKEISIMSPSLEAERTVIAGVQSDSQILDNNARLLGIKEQVSFINRLAVSTSMSPSDQIDFDRLKRDIKLSLIRSIWNKNWGDYIEFESWAKHHSLNEPNAEARNIFERL